jgi:hypothetical protein
VKVKVSNSQGQSAEFKTKVVEGGEKNKKITWGETFTVPLKPNTGALFEFTVLDEDVTSDDVCGRALFKPDKCGAFNYGGSQKYNIRLVNGATDEVSGELHITTRYV